MEPEELHLELPGGKLAALAWGPPDGQPVLALHGWLDNAHSFLPLAGHLSGLRVVALDLPGHGLSEHRPPGAAYHFVDWVVDAVGAADALGWERFALLGHSMGAGVASLVAGTVPARVSHLALIEGLGPLSVPPEEAPARLAQSIVRSRRRSRRPARLHPDREAAAERLRAASPGLAEEAARLLVERGTKEVAGGVLWRADPRLRALSPMRMTEEHVHAFLRAVRCPTLLLRAREGYAFDQKLLLGRLECLRAPEVHELSGGHHVHMEDPAAVAALLVPFFARESDPGADAEGPLGSPAVTLDDLTALAEVRGVILDVDGVLTTGLLPWSAEGNDRLTFDVRDGLGIKLLQRAGISVALLSGRAPEAVRHRAAALGIRHLRLGDSNKIPHFESLLAEMGLEARQVAYMGDDLPDLPVLRAAGYAAAPADARPEVRAAARFVAGAPGGRGAVRELAEHLLKGQGRWHQLLTGF